MIEELKLATSPLWECFDLQPGNTNVVPKFPIETRDTLADFPSKYGIAITNPPYLAKNSATRDGLPFPDCGFDDVYKHALDVMLSQVDYVAAIIPESFLTAGLFHDRLYGVATLNCRMFEDTECPVCLALFVPASVKRGSKDFLCYKGNFKFGNFSELCSQKDHLVRSGTKVEWKFNEQGGAIGLYAVDSQKGRTIRFVPGHAIDDLRIKGSSRSVTKIAGLPRGVAPESLIEVANELLAAFRDATYDVFLTSFKGMRSDGDYRRRLDYSLARSLLNASLDQITRVRHA